MQIPLSSTLSCTIQPLWEFQSLSSLSGTAKLCFGSSSLAAAWKLPPAAGQGDDRAHLTCFPFLVNHSSVLLVLHYLKTVVLYNLSSVLVVFSGAAVLTTVNLLWAETNPLTSTAIFVF